MKRVVNNKENAILRYLCLTSDILDGRAKRFPKNELQNIAGNLTLKDVYPSAKTITGSIGIEPNNYITSAEGRTFQLNQWNSGATELRK